MQSTVQRARTTRAAAAAGRAGFSMLEIMIAIAVLLISILGAFGSQLTSLNSIRTSRETDAAVSDLKACMEQILAHTSDEIPISGSLFEADLPVAHYTSLNLSDELLVPSYPGYTLGGEVPDPLEIVLTLDWSDYQGRARQLNLRSLKVR